jgi:DNA-binding NtrC family response regulator
MADDRAGTPAVGTHADTRLIVVVDADRREVARLARIVTDAGHPVISATDGRSALRHVFDSSVAPSLLVTSIDLPIMSGIELAARMAAARPGLQVILLSPDPQTVERARDHPTLARDVILQPVSAASLRDAIAAALPADK